MNVAKTNSSYKKKSKQNYLESPCILMSHCPLVHISQFLILLYNCALDISWTSRTPQIWLLFLNGLWINYFSPRWEIFLWSRGHSLQVFMDHSFEYEREEKNNNFKSNRKLEFYVIQISNFFFSGQILKNSLYFPTD